MTVRDIVNDLETGFPASLAESWDNVGLLCGDAQAEVSAVVVALDATARSVAFAKEHGAQLLVVHHPVIFHPLSALTPAEPAYLAVQNGIAVFCAHTNLDAAPGGVNDSLALALELTEAIPTGKFTRFGRLPYRMDPPVFAKWVAGHLHTDVQMRAGIEPVRTVCLCSGAGGDALASCTADAFVTGEMKHHEWLSVPPRVTAVAAGHFATEAVVIDPLVRRLSRRFWELTVIPFRDDPPYITVTQS